MSIREEREGVLVGGVIAPPATWATTHPMFSGSSSKHIIAGLVASLDSLAVVDGWRGQGIARALVTEGHCQLELAALGLG